MHASHDLFPHPCRREKIWCCVKDQVAMQCWMIHTTKNQKAFVVDSIACSQGLNLGQLRPEAFSQPYPHASVAHAEWTFLPDMSPTRTTYVKWIHRAWQKCWELAGMAKLFWFYDHGKSLLDLSGMADWYLAPSKTHGCSS